MRTLSICLTCIVGTMIGAPLLAQESADELVTVTAKKLQLDVPSKWNHREPSSTMRAAEFGIPAAKSGDEDAELVVYYFGTPTGGTHANVQRWIDQFYPDGRKHEIFDGQCRDGSYTLVSISGTYKKPDGPPAAQKTIDTPNSRVIGVVLRAEMDAGADYYFLKLSGPDELVNSQSQAVRTAIGADADSEKSVKIDELGE